MTATHYVLVKIDGPHRGRPPAVLGNPSGKLADGTPFWEGIEIDDYHWGVFEDGDVVSVAKGRLQVYDHDLMAPQPRPPELKESNPKQLFGDQKAPLHLVPATLQLAASVAFAEGAAKYGAFNWRVAGVQASTYKAAALRHIERWYNGEDADPETGVPHLFNAIACLGILVDAQAAGKLNDDRPPKIDISRFLDEAAEAAVKVREKFADRSPKHCYARDQPE